jgi:hypothetical protein
VLLGVSPGCLGAFAVVTLYSHRMVSFGALVATLIATSGDEAFVLLALFPRTAVLLTAGLAVLGWVVGVATDRFLPERAVPDAHRFELHAADDGPRLPLTHHFLEEHLWRHVVLQHVPRVFAWTTGALLVTQGVVSLWPGSSTSGATGWAVLAGAAVLGLVPESGPHLLFVTLFDEGLVPLSTLAASSVVQDGHGALPLLAHSRGDFVKAKAINLLVGLMVGAAMRALGY